MKIKELKVQFLFSDISTILWKGWILFLLAICVIMHVFHGISMGSTSLYCNCKLYRKYDIAST